MTNAKMPGAAYDNKIYAKFSKNTIDKKAINKKEFCAEFELKCDDREFLLGIVAPLTEKNGGETFENLLNGLEVLPIKIAVRGIGTAKFQKLLADFAEKNPEKITVVPDDEIGVRKLLAAADATIFFADGAENELLARAARSYAALPIAPKSFSHLIDDYNPNQESGTGFLFPEKNAWSAFAAIVRALENYRFPYDFKTIQKSAIEI